MSIPVNIDELINQQVVESTRIEYKESFNPDPIIRTIGAFANDIDNIGGGYIIIGVGEENGMPKFPIKGLSKASIDSTLKKLREYCHFIEPIYNPVVEPVVYNDANLIVVWVSGGYGRPYKAPKSVLTKQSVKHYYIRKFSSTVIASAEEEKELFYVSESIPFDDRENLAASLEDLDLGIIREHLKEVKSSLYEKSVTQTLEQTAKDLQIIGGPPERLKPLNVGLLMFSEHPEKFFRYAQIEVVDIPDPTGRNMVEKTFTGPIQRQLKDALLYIRNYAIKEAVIKVPNQAESIRVFNYPYDAVEEILSNAVYHRSYQIHEPITVRITADYMEITSFPGFDRSITDTSIENEDIRARSYRNRRIGDFLKELHLIEGRNTGFPNARKALEENGSPKLEFVMDDERNYLSVVIRSHAHFVKETPKSSEYETRIINILKKEPMSLTNLAKELGYKGITAKLSKTVNDMKKKGVLKDILGDDGKPKISVE